MNLIKAKNDMKETKADNVQEQSLEENLQNRCSQVFSSEICGIFKNSFYKTSPVTASVLVIL